MLGIAQLCYALFLLAAVFTLQCNADNFPDRTVCYKCNEKAPAGSSRTASGARDCLAALESATPTNVLLLRELSMHTTEEKVSTH
jgi:hypothetical protein